MPKTAARQHLTTVAGLDGFWATIAGGRTSVDHQKVYDGGKLNPDLLQSAPTHEDLTVSRPFDTTRDAPIAARLRRILSDGGEWSTTVSKVPTDGDFTPIGGAVVHEVRLKSVKDPDGDAASNNPTMIELVFTTVNVR